MKKEISLRLKKCLYVSITLAFLTCLNQAQAQSPTTFTASDMTVTQTLTSMGRMNAAALTTSDTLRAIDHVVAEQNLQVKGAVTIAGQLTVTDTTQFNGEIKATKGFMFDANNSFKLTPIGGTNYFILGKSVYNPPTLGTCVAPANQPWMVMNGGGFISTQQHPAAYPNVNSSVKMFSAGWDGNGVIEVEGTSASGSTDNRLLVNYFCGRDVALCTNTGLSNGGGKVSVGNFLSAQQHVEIGEPQYGIALGNAPAGNIALDMHVNYGKAIRIRTYDINVPMFEVFNTNASINKTLFSINGNGQVSINSVNVNNKLITVTDLTAQAGSQEKFTVLGDGRTNIGGNIATATPYMLTVNGRIGAREIKVSMQTIWPDYVFSKDYKLESLSAVEKYIKKHNHLPNIPSAAELNKEELGLDIAQMQSKQMEKIEEIYLYLFQMKKEVEILKDENAKLKKELKK